MISDSCFSAALFESHSLIVQLHSSAPSAHLIQDFQLPFVRYSSVFLSAPPMLVLYSPPLFSCLFKFHLLLKIFSFSSLFTCSCVSGLCLKFNTYIAILTPNVLRMRTCKKKRHCNYQLLLLYQASYICVREFFILAINLLSIVKLVCLENQNQTKLQICTANGNEAFFCPVEER